MKSTIQTGKQIKQDNGSGHSLAMAFPKRRFIGATVYVVKYEGTHLDNSTVRSIERLKKGY